MAELAQEFDHNILSYSIANTGIIIVIKSRSYYLGNLVVLKYYFADRKHSIFKDDNFDHNENKIQTWSQKYSFV